MTTAEREGLREELAGAVLKEMASGKNTSCHWIADAVMVGPIFSAILAQADTAAQAVADRDADPNEVTPDMLAAAWEVVRNRYPHGRVLGPGPGFREAIAAALARRPLCDLEARIVEAETTAEVDREFAETSRQQATAAQAEVARLSAEVERLRAALDQAEACLSIVEPRTDRAEYLRTLDVVRTALAAGQDKEGGKP